MTGAREDEKAVPGQVDRRWLFGTAVLDERTLEVQVHGQPVEIERKSLQVLMHLLNHAGEVVTKDELLASVWPGRILSDSVITSCMARLRDALGDETQSVIKTVHGYGYRLIAPVKVETVGGLPPQRFEFKPGEHLPARALWSLVERLGTGGHGEAWLARHDKTHEKRVYKFAADSEALVLLKREITIYRLLHDSLGDRADFVHLLDWNLEEPPYFVEYDYLECGSLSTWAKAQGGLERVPLATRLDLAAQTADALGAAHSIGVLHKDLKPSNVLIEVREGGAPQIRLCDFGSGGVLDVGRLEQMGITRLGFTRTLTAYNATGGTPLYLAPEVVAGQPFTVQADIYSLGVMLYQFVVGNFHKQLAPGWEQDVADELLREDIALASDGDPSRRLADAAQLAQRLRSLEARRAELTRQRARQAEAERTRRAMERMQARRKWMVSTIVVLAAGVAVSLALYLDSRRARNEAAAAAATSRAVSDFLTKDVFAAVNLEQRSIRNLKVKELLDAAAAGIDARFSDEPRAAAQVHAALGTAFLALDATPESRRHLERALALYEEHAGPAADPALDIVGPAMQVHYVLGQLRAEMPRYQRLLEAARLRLGRNHPKVMELRQQLAKGHYWLGAWRQAAELQRAVVADARGAEAPDEVRVALAEMRLGTMLLAVADYAEAEEVLRRNVQRFAAQLGDEHLHVAYGRMALGAVLTELGREAEAELELAAALAAARALVDEQHGFALSIREFQGRLRLAQRRPADAESILEDVLAAYEAAASSEMDQSATIRRALAAAYQQQGRLREAERAMREALAAAEKSLGPQHPDAQGARVDLADILREQGHPAEARQVLAEADAASPNLPAAHPLTASLRRVEGLLWLADGDTGRARAALAEALQTCERRYGPAHALTRRARAELARVPAVGARP